MVILRKLTNGINSLKELAWNDEAFIYDLVYLRSTKSKVSHRISTLRSEIVSLAKLYSLISLSLKRQILKLKSFCRNWQTEHYLSCLVHYIFFASPGTSQLSFKLNISFSKSCFRVNYSTVD